MYYNVVCVVLHPTISMEYEERRKKTKIKNTSLGDMEDGTSFMQIFP